MFRALEKYSKVFQVTQMQDYITKNEAPSELNTF